LVQKRTKKKKKRAAAYFRHRRRTSSRRWYIRFSLSYLRHGAPALNCGVLLAPFGRAWTSASPSMPSRDRTLCWRGAYLFGYYEQCAETGDGTLRALPASLLALLAHTTRTPAQLWRHQRLPPPPGGGRRTLLAATQEKTLASAINSAGGVACLVAVRDSELPVIKAGCYLQGFAEQLAFALRISWRRCSPAALSFCQRAPFAFFVAHARGA